MTVELWKDIFVERVRDLMYEKNMTQREMANKTGIGTNNISQYLNGDKTPSVNVLLKICDALECTMDKLVV